VPNDDLVWGVGIHSQLCIFTVTKSKAILLYPPLTVSKIFINIQYILLIKRKSLPVSELEAEESAVTFRYFLPVYDSRFFFIRGCEKGVKDYNGPG
jgi:hypothetical protein